MKMQPLWFVSVIVFAESLNFKTGNGETVPDDVTLSIRDTWKLEVKWTTNGHETGQFRTYEIQIGRNSSLHIVGQSNVSAAAGVKVHTWVWTSLLPLQCTDHSVRIRRIFNSSVAGSWSQWVTNRGQQNNTSKTVLIFPKEKLLLVGSNATFCCIPPAGSKVIAMKFWYVPYSLTLIDGVWAIQVPRLNFSQFGQPLYCLSDSGVNHTVLNYITFRPEKPQNLQCKTTDMRTAVCSWTPMSYRRRTYALRIHSCRNSGGDEMSCDGKSSSCVFPLLPNCTFYNLSVVVRNSLGEESQSEEFNITDRVFPVPKYITVEAGVTDAAVNWKVKGSFRGLQLICQIALEPSGRTTELHFAGSDSEQHLSVRLQQLEPSTQYSSIGRCAVQGGDWGAWSSASDFSTEPLVTVDVWRRINGHNHQRNVTVMWKTFNSGSPSNIEAFKVCLEQKEAQQKKCEKVTQSPVDFRVGVEAWNVSVRAVINAGRSLPSQIHVPQFQKAPKLEEKRIVGNSTGFLLTWSTLPSAKCGYTVEWCMMGRAEPCELQWSKVPVNQTTLFLKAEMFKKGKRYIFKIFSCRAEEHQIFEKQTGYLEELRPLQSPDLHHSLNVSWSSVLLEWSFDEDDPDHPGFITGYLVTVQRESSWSSDHGLFNISVDDPVSKSLQIDGLRESQRYTFRLAACTRVGCGLNTTRTITTLHNRYLLLVKLLIPLLILISCCVCLWHCRKTLKGIAVDIFIFPTDQTLKRLELNDELYKVSERIQALTVEDCNCCSLEVVREETSQPLLVRPKPESDLTLVWGGLPEETVTVVTNFTYIFSPQDNTYPDTLPETAETQHYVTTVSVMQV